MDKIVKEIVTKESFITVTLKDGSVQKIPALKKYTYYTDGSNDFEVNIQKPLKLSGQYQEE